MVIAHLNGGSNRVLRNGHDLAEPKFSAFRTLIYATRLCQARLIPPNSMKLNLAIALCASLLWAPAARAADADYKPGPDSFPQPGVPQGELLKFTFDHSRIFPGTVRTYWIYVPAQYRPETPACLFVDQDGVEWKAPVVFDNLIARKEMPVTIGVFVQPGIVKSPAPGTALDRDNRSFEYDGLGEAYVRFLLEELLPEVVTGHASDGRPIRISGNANDRAIAGQSSGAICAFTAAWERPDSFSRVFSAIGTFVGLRGGEVYPTLIRKFEPKPIRVFLQDGSNDHNSYAGDWWMANLTMERALAFAGYEVNHVWGDGIHSGRHATAIFPDAMRWLWKDWPRPVETGKSGNAMLGEILLPGENWELVGEGYKATDGPAVNARGEVFFTDRAGNRTYRIGLDGKVGVFLEDCGWASGQAFGPDGRLYSLGGLAAQVLSRGAAGGAKVVAEGITHGNDLVVAHNGNLYVTDDSPSSDPAAPSKVWLIRPDGTKLVVDSGLRFANGIALSPDQSLLYVDDSRSHWVYSYQVQPDGTLRFKQPYVWLHESVVDDDSGADGMRVDRDGRIYVTTRLGIQVSDQAGRINCILPTPNGRVSSLTFGGPKFDTLFAACGDRVYKRRLKIQGANAWAEPSSIGKRT